jgi:hypothetical protein
VKDATVLLASVKHFMKQVKSSDKEIKVFDYLAHEAICEQGCGEARDLADVCDRQALVHPDIWHAQAPLAAF